MAERKLVIGIHGLANKPDRNTLQGWWLESIREGLAAEQSRGNRRAAPEFDFEMIYWADLLYAYPLHRRPHMEFDPLFNDEPYVAAVRDPDPEKDEIREYREGLRDRFVTAARGLIGDTIDSLKEHYGFNAVADFFLAKVLKDLAFYYAERPIPNRQGETASAKSVLRKELADVLLNNRDRELCLIAHSMGSIIAYDVLRVLGESSGLEVASLITIGSPLGLPHVKGKILEEARADNREVRVRTPTVVTREWLNFSDRRDPVAADARLADDYGKNAAGVQVRDDLVENTYHVMKHDGDHANPHKSYGYLRTPEVSRAILKFLRAR